MFRKTYCVLVSFLRFAFLFFCFSCALFAGKQVNISLEWLLSPHHIPLIIAKHCGFFEREGLDVSILSSIGSTQSCQMVACDQMDYAITHESKIAEMQDKGLKLTPVFKLIPTCLTVFVSHYPLEELKGKKIGHPSKNPCIGIKCLMKKYNYKPGDLNLLYVRTAFVQSFLAHSIDAVTGIWGIYEGELIRKHCPKARFYSYKDLGVPDFSDAMIVKSCNNNTSDASFKRALCKAIDYIKKNPQQAYQIAIRNYPVLDNALNKKTWPAFVSLFSKQ
jgi:ABC-type nitrate/sulfonate/bicarbonate transport system substrate-binding protein